MSIKEFPSAAPAPDWGLTKDPTLNVQVGKYNEGYEQRAPNGPHSLLYSWSLSWSNLAEAEASTISRFLNEECLGVHTFMWIDPYTGNRKKVLCRAGVKSVNDAYGNYNLSAQFEELP